MEQQLVASLVEADRIISSGIVIESISPNLVAELKNLQAYAARKQMGGGIVERAGRILDRLEAAAPGRPPGVGTW